MAHAADRENRLQEIAEGVMAKSGKFPQTTDELIAAVVMGWKLYGHGFYEVDEQRRSSRIPAFSTDLNQAFRVVEKMIADGFDFGLCRTPDSPWSVRFERDSIEDEDCAAPEGLPALICEMAVAVRADWEQHWGTAR